ncbi:uncharacterized protein C3orf85 homolog [Anolis carolinensis]|uniref:uncharacterized protein C3orf85 homolog n=1 Tax=Anolis carolinensis TaxID=28377 RepID=UPI002F2B5DB7
MAMTIFHLVLCAVVLKGVLGLPFASEEEANQFLGLKRQAPYFDYLQLTSGQNTLAEKVSEAWTALKKSVQYYMSPELFPFDTNTAKKHISSYMDMLHQSEAGLKRQRRHVISPEPLEIQPCPFWPKR